MRIVDASYSEKIAGVTWETLVEPNKGLMDALLVGTAITLIASKHRALADVDGPLKASIENVNLFQVHKGKRETVRNFQVATYINSKPPLHVNCTVGVVSGSNQAQVGKVDSVY
jgi:hypothetical protein